ncbi:HAD family hydrolase [Streptomyces nymphaeiformis]|uniref:Putative hydrolase of the HAD superfamily n=1 Tax=Streptomyces nymphaeiformis TaxID=2663842 RepID=A0A7W7TZ00_9ACTN|nr:HAD family hydrolase [Streptomyces nymphaeiformis]MBB4981551.1 putative hydrolase of the HAD superfamily [Streptomyces nymphaeiformis]
MTGQVMWPEVRAVCFDLGGTLVRPEAVATTGQVAEVLGISLDEARALMGKGAKRRLVTPQDLAHELAADFGRPALADRLAEVLERARRRAENPQLYADVPDMLAELRARGYALYAMTNALGSSVPEQDPPAFREFLDGVFYSARTGAIKPEREAFAAVERTGGLRPGELLHVGDSMNADVRGAAAAGWNTAWVDRHRTTGPLMLAASTPRLHSLNTLPLLLPARAAAGTITSEVAG